MAAVVVVCMYVCVCGRKFLSHLYIMRKLLPYKSSTLALGHGFDDCSEVGRRESVKSGDDQSGVNWSTKNFLFFTHVALCVCCGGQQPV